MYCKWLVTFDHQTTLFTYATKLVASLWRRKAWIQVDSNGLQKRCVFKVEKNSALLASSHCSLLFWCSQHTEHVAGQQTSRPCWSIGFQFYGCFNIFFLLWKLFPIRIYCNWYEYKLTPAAFSMRMETSNFFTATFQAYRGWLFDTPKIDLGWSITLIASRYPANFKMLF